MIIIRYVKLMENVKLKWKRKAVLSE